ncbi:MAG: 3-dehydroquinate synthase family protein [Acidimicrobiia bacterium]
MERVTVALSGAPYDVVIGAGARRELPTVLGDRRQVVVVTQKGIVDNLGEQLPWPTVFMGDGEEAKSLETIDALCRGFAAAGLLRGDAIVALGGGVVGDTAGFAAAVYYRGIAVVQVPTTLLAQVDAAIGGKTAVNLPEGKNLVGAFHQPIAVIADVETLATLPAREYRAGLGEVAKYALMPQGGRVAAIIRDRAPEIMARDPGALTDLVAACVAIKAAVVAADPEERTGLRATLNYGHTLAHALETAGSYELLHGEAVAVGLVFADALALATERIDTGAVEEHRRLLESLGLPTSAPDAATATELLGVMQRDKKAKGGLTFVLPGADGLETVDDPPPNALTAAFRAVGIDADVGS